MDRGKIIADMLARGHTRKDIAERLGITASGLSAWMRRHGMARRYTHIPFMMELIREGAMTTSEIATTVGVTTQAVEQYCLTHNLRPKRVRLTFSDEDEIELTIAADVIRAVARRLGRKPSSVAYALARRLT